jgi:hypothetical protein
VYPRGRELHPHGRAMSAWTLGCVRADAQSRLHGREFFTSR